MQVDIPNPCVALRVVDKEGSLAFVVTKRRLTLNGCATSAYRGGEEAQLVCHTHSDVLFDLVRIKRAASSGTPKKSIGQIAVAPHTRMSVHGHARKSPYD